MGIKWKVDIHSSIHDIFNIFQPVSWSQQHLTFWVLIFKVKCTLVAGIFLSGFNGFWKFQHFPLWVYKNIIPVSSLKDFVSFLKTVIFAILRSRFSQNAIVKSFFQQPGRNANLLLFAFWPLALFEAKFLRSFFIKVVQSIQLRVLVIFGGKI